MATEPSAFPDLSDLPANKRWRSRQIGERLARLARTLLQRGSLAGQPIEQRGQRRRILRQRNPRRWTLPLSWRG